VGRASALVQGVPTKKNISRRGVVRLWSTLERLLQKKKKLEDRNERKSAGIYPANIRGEEEISKGGRKECP